MGVRHGPVAAAADRAKVVGAEVAREFKDARLDRSLTQDRVGRSIGVSASWISRFESGATEPTLSQLVILFATVGLKLSIRG
ncbi:MAG: helix-turn-helix domain-containing protein, partial [Chloroflexota bacterium]